MARGRIVFKDGKSYVRQEGMGDIPVANTIGVDSLSIGDLVNFVPSDRTPDGHVEAKDCRVVREEKI